MSYTWITRNIWAAGPYYHSVSMNLNGHMMLLANYGTRAVSKSLDYGQNWIDATPTGPADYLVTAMSQTGAVALAAMNYGRAYLSTDGMGSWTEIRPAGDADISWACAAISANGSVIVIGGYQDRLYLSTDTGETWTEIRPHGGDWGMNWFSLDLSYDGSTILVGTGYFGSVEGQVFLSTDTGASWTDVTPNAYDNDYWNVACDDTGQIIHAWDDWAYLYRSENACASWTNIPAPVEDSGWYGIGCSKDGQIVMGWEYMNDETYLSTDGCDTWNLQENLSYLLMMDVRAYISPDGHRIVYTDSWAGVTYIGDDGLGYDSEQVAPEIKDNTLWLGCHL